MIIFEDFVLRAFTAGIGIAVTAGVLGCFVVWRRMAYFGDSLSHSALLGVSIGISAGLSIAWGFLLACSVFAVLLVYLERKKVLATDTLLGILAHAALSIGIIALHLLGQEAHVHDYLFGDILTITDQELYSIYIGGAIVLVSLLVNWSSLVLMVIHEDLAIAERVRVAAQQMLFMFLMATVIAVSIRIVGLLLVTSMLIIPAAIARQLTRSPEAMGVVAPLVGIVSVIAGVIAAVTLDIPAGPSIVAAATVCFILVLAGRELYT